MHPISNMKVLLLLSLVVTANAYRPMNQRTWINFVTVKYPDYDTDNVPEQSKPDIIHTEYIDV